MVIYQCDAEGRERQTRQGRWWANKWKHFLNWAPVLQASVCQAFSIYASIPENGQSRASLLPWGPPSASVVAFSAENRGMCSEIQGPCCWLWAPKGSSFPLSFFLKDWDNSEEVYKVTALIFLLFHKSQSRQVTNNPSFQKASIWARMLHRNSTCIYL